MKIAVSALGSDPRCAVAPTFARCPYFIVVDTERDGVEAITNPGAGLDSGAATGSVQVLVEAGVRTVLIQRCGPRAATALAAAGITVSQGHSGTVTDTINAFTAELSR
jgi:predicted Fe-Mo cluster-binding NifX family protein